MSFQSKKCQKVVNKSWHNLTNHVISILSIHGKAVLITVWTTGHPEWTEGGQDCQHRAPRKEPSVGQRGGGKHQKHRVRYSTLSQLLIFPATFFVAVFSLDKNLPLFLHICRSSASVQKLCNPHALHAGYATFPTSLQAYPAAAHDTGTHAGQEAGQLAGLPTLWAWWEMLHSYRPTYLAMSM